MIADHLGSKACPAFPNIYGLSKDQCATLNLSLVLKNEDFQQGDLTKQRIQIESLSSGYNSVLVYIVIRGRSYSPRSHGAP